ncbi:ATP-binding cassette domain-containing protein, partial [Mesorhizobium sp. M5C.F.Ca.ET.164.01.1.1]|uniref:ATP-binding cassette domain-containing protein n=1 Tax=Mesorhizobium sp. M5C.F.Ca.ET.164.01.1.1 TaxID=2563957 RepID=UPI0010935A8B
SGVYTDYEGTVAIDDQAVRFAGVRDAEDAGIAIIHQELNLVPELSVADNIFLGRELHPLRLDEVSMEVRAWTLLKELSARIPSVREPVASLSGGQRQTVA